MEPWKPRKGVFRGVLKAPERLARVQRLRDGIVIDDASWKELQDCERKLGLAG
jgi:LDH2 family malate/lactate/ureidoglycolate dehydrogenase